ncbi:hypothetical protein N7536_010023 [Penicillium majusculum]|nr:hypothetical protein N7536_010023 [Penicillium majusculum]
MAHYFRGLEINPFNIQNIEDMISCTKSIPAEYYPSRDISYWDTVRKAEDVLSEKVVAGIKEMRYLGGAAGIDQVLDASGADAIILPSIICADVPGLVGYPIITVPMGFSLSDTPVTLNERGNLVWDGPNIPYGLSFIGRSYSEERLNELAYTFEQSIQSKSEGRSFASPKSDLNRSSRPVSFMFDVFQAFYTHFFS